jgi:hypothetical protein
MLEGVIELRNNLKAGFRFESKPDLREVGYEDVT